MRIKEIAGSSIGRKFSVAVAGLLLCGFLVFHLAGNLILFAGPGPFNRFAETLDKNPLIPVAEIGLAVLFILHMVVALILRWRNARARPVGYVDYESKGGRTLGSRTMTVSALILLAFLIIHLKDFRFGDDSNGHFQMVIGAFQNKVYASFYVLAMIALGLHLSHGFQSAFQTLGINHPRYTPLIKKTGVLFAVVIAGGFAVLPIWAGFFGGGAEYLVAPNAEMQQVIRQLMMATQPALQKAFQQAIQDAAKKKQQ
jgi:succinate dehydrogenase / fumarate reductase cytochrome b subunit